jgi:hypothetical protein
MDEMTKAVLAAWRDRFPNNAYAWPGAPESFAAEAVRVTLAAQPAAPVGDCSCLRPGGDPLGNCEECATRAAPPPSTQKVREVDVEAIAREIAPYTGAISVVCGEVATYYAGFNLSEFARRILSTNPGEQKTTTAEGQT